MEYSRNTIIWGFAFIKNISDLNMSNINDTLFDREVDIDKVIFSFWNSSSDNCIWVIAANRYMNEIEIKDALNYIIENELEDNYLFNLK